MRRILPIVLLVAILLGACAPNVMLFTQEPSASPTVAFVPDSLTATPTLVPTPTGPPDLGVSAGELKGLEVLVWHGWDGKSADLFARMAADFTLSNQWGIKVKIVPWTNLNLLAEETGKVLGVAEQPDVVVAMPEQILAWRANAVDLSPYLAQVEFGLDAADVSGAFWEQSDLNGVRYGVPAGRSARFLFYNLSFAHDLGFDTAPQSAEDFRKQACAGNAFWKQDKDLTNDGFGGLVLDVAPNWQTPYTWLVMGGGQLFADGTFTFNTPENLSALEFVSKLREDGCAWQANTTSNYEHLASRHALFTTGNLGELNEQNFAFSTAASADAWTVLPFPGEKPGIVAYGPDYAVLKSTGPRQLAAWLFIRWMLQAQNQAHWSRGTGLLPVTASAVKILEADSASIPSQWMAALRLIPQAVPYPQSVDWRLADKVLADGFLSYFENFPGADLARVLKVMDATVSDLTK